MGSGQGAVGDTIPLVGGETCLGFFLDGDEAQQPVIMGVLDRQNNVENAIDEPELASHQSSDGRPFTGGNTDKLTKFQKIRNSSYWKRQSRASKTRLQSKDRTGYNISERKDVSCCYNL